MTCGACGASIADKAIVCYRCGTATTAPTPQKTETGAPAAAPWLAFLVLGTFAALLGWLAWTLPAGSLERTLAIVAAFAALGALGWRVTRGR